MGKTRSGSEGDFRRPVAGTGAIFKWAGNKEVGEGSMTITESRPSDLIRIKLEFLRPFEATNSAEFTFKSKYNADSVQAMIEPWIRMINTW